MKHQLSIYGLTVLIAVASAVLTFTTTSVSAQASGPVPTPTDGKKTMNKTDSAPHPYTGMWVTKDGYIRHELLPGGRYDEARGKRKSAYQGSYRVTGSHIDYVDDTGFTADGEFRDGILYHAGMVLYRER